MMYPSPYMSYPTHFPPNNDMKMDPRYHQPWPCYPGPHGCCNHGCYGGGGPYTFPHYPPPQPIFHANGFHPFSGAYSIPPPHYSVEQPRYDYDKNNYVPHPKAETKTSEPLVPLFLKDSPYPIMWVPSSGNSNSESKANDNDKKSDEPLVPLFLKDSPYPIMWVPPSVYMNQDSKHSHDPVAFKDAEEPMNQGENGERNHLPFPIFWLPSKNTKDNNLDENRRHDSDSEMRNKHVQKVIPVKQVGEKQEKKSLETKTESDSVEKKDKASKLPPVCLRIEPLPTKKKASSRSPSPPGEKERSKSSLQETHLQENSKKNLSEKEAALMIQSVYRGFEVRKSQPLMKLRQIGEVTKQAVEIRNRIQDMESSFSAVGIDDKWKVAVGETVMSLLLKLDTIQGLHPAVRDVRKSVAKELVGLQEKLDSLTSIKSKTPGHFKDDALDEKIEQSDNNIPLAESGSGLSVTSHDDSGLEAYNTNVELRKEGSVGDDVIQHKFDQAVTEFDSTNEAIGSVKNNIEELNSDKLGVIDKTMESVTDTCEKHVVRSAESDIDATEAGDIFKPEQIQMSVETDPPLDDVQVESDNTNEDVGLDRVIFENQDSMDSNAEGARDIRTEHNTEELNSDKHVETEYCLDDSIQEKSDKMEAEYGVIDKTMESVTDTCEKHEAEIAESDVGAIEAGDISFEQHDESESQHSIIIPETEQAVKQEKPVETKSECESDVEKVEDKECKDVSMVEMNVELSKEDATEGIQNDLMVQTKEVPKAHDFDPKPANGGDRKLMEENDKLRLAVEELLSQQSGVIRELKRKVEDLEKKLSKKNKKTKVNKCRSRGFVVQDVI